MQVRAADGLVNFYLPGYAQSGLGASLRRVGSSIKSKFTDTNDQVIAAYITVRPDVIAALAAVVRGGGSMEVRANSARALGILRARQAVPDLIAALRTKDTEVLYESLIAIQKIRDQSAGPRISFLLRDLNSKVQIAAIETTGLLNNREAAPDLIEVLQHAKEAKVRRAALSALAMMPDPARRDLYAQYLQEKDEKLRAAAAEGFGRLHNAGDLPMLEKAWQDEAKTSPRLSLAFAQTMLGKTELTEFSPLQFLVNTLNSSSYKGEAYPFLVELARDARVRTELYGPLATGTRDEKTGLARVLAVSGDKTSLAPLEKLSRDTDSDVAQEGLRALKTLQARM